MKGYFKFLFNDFKETFKECTFIEKFLLIGYMVLIPFLAVLLSIDVVDTILNGPIWAAIFLSFFNTIFWMMITAFITMTIWVYNDLKDII